MKIAGKPYENLIFPNKKSSTVLYWDTQYNNAVSLQFFFQSVQLCYILNM